MHRFLLHNDRIVESSAILLSPGQVGLLSGWGVFSTLRVFDGVLFAWERHWHRMRRDAELLRVPFPGDPDPIHDALLRLIEANQAANATLRLIVVRNRRGVWEGPGIERDFDVIAFTTKVKDWGKSVRLTVEPHARHAACAFAGVKMLSWSFNLVWLEQAQGRGFDEVILLNERGEVSECTSANLFAAFGRRVVTPPLTSGCLPGITRELLMEEIRVPGYQVVEQDLTAGRSGEGRRGVHHFDHARTSSSRRDRRLEGRTERRGAAGFAGRFLQILRRLCACGRRPAGIDLKHFKAILI